MFEKSIVLVSILLLLVSCSCKKMKKPENYEKESLPIVVDNSKDSPIIELKPKKDFKTVSFDFDKADLTDKAKDKLKQNIMNLKINSDSTVLVIGHCDERGSIDYNFKLGYKRASAIKKYYVANGIDPERIYLKSFGEEKPLDFGHTDEAWAKNRRAMTVLYE